MKNKGLIIYVRNGKQFHRGMLWYDYPLFNPKQRWYVGRKYKAHDGSICVVEKVDVVTGGPEAGFLKVYVSKKERKK